MRTMYSNYIFFLILTKDYSFPNRCSPLYYQCSLFCALAERERDRVPRFERGFFYLNFHSFHTFLQSFRSSLMIWSLKQIFLSCFFSCSSSETFSLFNFWISSCRVATSSTNTLVSRFPCTRKMERIKKNFIPSFVFIWLTFCKIWFSFLSLSISSNNWVWKRKI